MPRSNEQREAAGYSIDICKRVAQEIGLKFNIPGHRDQIRPGDAANADYVRPIIDAVEVDDRAIRIIGSKDILQAAIAVKQTENENLRGFVRTVGSRRGWTRTKPLKR